jgi:cell division protein FtsQ
VNTPRSEQPVKFWRKRIVVMGAGAALVLVVAIGLLAWFARPVLVGPKLTTLTIGGKLTHVDANAVRAAVVPNLGSGFFTTHVDRIGDAVGTLPWVAETGVRREWPHTLHVDIVEEVPVARWGDDGLMDAQGKVFVHAVDKAYASLPQLSGRDAAAADVLAQYNTLSALVAPRGIAIVALNVDARGAATVELDDGIEVRLGREEASERLARFSALALPALAAKLTAVAYVDMRYTNGFAVGWKSGKNGNQGTRPNA